METDSLGDRMKRYESSYDISIIRRIPIVIRCDGKNFSKFTQCFEKPFDLHFNNAMSSAMFFVASKIDGCVFGYTESDEITFIVRNDKILETEPWFGNRVQKIASIVSSMITSEFAKAGKFDTIPYFDTRVFAVPNLIEAANALIWKQNDCVKNSISCACYWEVVKKIGKKTARNKMHCLNQKQQQELLFSETGINWNDYQTRFKRGIACYRIPSNLMTRNWVWNLDFEISRWTSDGEFDKLIDKLNTGYNNET